MNPIQTNTTSESLLEAMMLVRAFEMNSVALQQIGARLATQDEARLLNEPAGAALLTMQRTAYDESHKPVEFGMHVYRASMYSYDQTVIA